MWQQTEAYHHSWQTQNAEFFCPQDEMQSKSPYCVYIEFHMF